MLDGVALSALDWWQEAGVDTLVDETARDWLAPAAPPPAAAPPAPVTPAYPETLEGFRRWLLEDRSLPGAPAARIDADGDPATGTMVLIDMPEADDRAARKLLSGEAGELFGRMLKAMGLSREAIYLAAVSPGRAPSGKLDAAALAVLAPHAARHVALAAPKRLLLLGDAATRALAGLSCAEARGRVLEIAPEGVPLRAVASFHPRFLLQKPERKAAAWADLQLFMGL